MERNLLFVCQNVKVSGIEYLFCYILDLLYSGPFYFLHCFLPFGCRASVEHRFCHG